MQLLIEPRPMSRPPRFEMSHSIENVRGTALFAVLCVGSGLMEVLEFESKFS